MYILKKHTHHIKTQQHTNKHTSKNINFNIILANKHNHGNYLTNKNIITIISSNKHNHVM